MTGGLNRVGPIEALRSDNARVMHALVVAMKAAQNWHDTLAVADLIIDIQVCRFGPMLKELEYLSSDGPMTAEHSAQPEAERAR